MFVLVTGGPRAQARITMTALTVYSRIWIYLSDFGDYRDTAFIMFPITRFPRPTALTLDGYPVCFMRMTPRVVSWTLIMAEEIKAPVILLTAWY